MRMICPLAVAIVLSRSTSLRADFIRGDVDMSMRLDVSDAVKILNMLFLGSVDIVCLDAADANDSGELDVSDPVYILSHLFLGGPAPRAPYPGMGLDPTADQLACDVGMDPVHRWNAVAINASGLDHTPPGPGEERVWREQMGPGRASRAIAIAHIAMFEVVNAIHGGYESYADIDPAPEGASLDAGVAQAARDTLVVLFPAQTAIFDAFLVEDLSRIPEGTSKEEGIDLGARVAAAVLALRADDGSNHPEPMVGVDWTPSTEPGHWRPDPISQLPVALGAHWGEVRPFILESGSQFRTPPPPALTSAEYATAFEEVKRLGGDGVTTATERTEEQTQIGLYWAYDGTPSLCAPPKLYNQIVMEISAEMGSNMVEMARLLVLVNVAMADAGIAIWESKYHHDFWRPVGGIREADTDGNPATVADPTFSPLGAPASGLSGPNFTPPFPAYPSGHAGFGGAVFQMLRRFYGKEDIAFEFISDELNGVTHDNQGNPRTLVMRSFDSLSAPEEENGQSRIYLGIHWAFDKTEGIAQGRRVADWVFERLFQPTP